MYQHLVREMKASEMSQGRLFEQPSPEAAHNSLLPDGTFRNG